MISSFSVMTMGQVLQGDGIGFDGTPANDRWYPNQRLIEAVDMSLETAQLMRASGTTCCGWRSTISSGRGTSAYPTS